MKMEVQMNLKKNQLWLQEDQMFHLLFVSKMHHQHISAIGISIVYSTFGKLFCIIRRAPLDLSLRVCQQEFSYKRISMARPRQT